MNIELTAPLIEELQKHGFSWNPNLVGGIQRLTDLTRGQIIPGQPLPSNHWNFNPDDGPPTITLKLVAGEVICQSPFVSAKDPEANYRLASIIAPSTS